MPDEQLVLPNLARASTLLRNAATSMDGRGSDALRNLQTLLQNAGWTGPVISQITPSLQALSPEVYRVFAGAVTLALKGGPPQATRNFGYLLDRVQGFLDTRAPDLQLIARALMPNVQGIGAAMMNVDTGQILSNMLAAVPEDGVITLRVNLQNP
ncbi:hypothetical protein ACNQR9_32680 [Mycolicibacterium peregrinum]